MIKPITVCITSCNRFDLLQRTLNSFFKVNIYPIERIIITEDSTKEDMRNKILSIYGDKVELIFNPSNLGPYRSIDNMYKMVNTEYIFHSEDDWEFISNPNFLKESLDILEERHDIHQIWIRKDYHSHEWIESEINSTKNGTQFKMLKVPHCGNWCGFSHNPGLRRKSDYLNMFPNGYSEFILPDKKAVFTEHNCNLHAMEQGYRAASLIETDCSCVHIGGGRTTL